MESRSIQLMENNTDLKDHANMGSIDAAYLEVIEQLNSSAAERVSFVSLSNALQKLDLVQGGLGVVRCAFHNFQGYKALLPGKGSLSLTERLNLEGYCGA